MKLIATCDSDKCAFVRIKIGTHKKKGKVYDRIEPKYQGAQCKNVEEHAVDCPDCGSVLFWTRVKQCNTL